MRITIPVLSLVVLIGASGSGKSIFARTHFLPTETLSSDACRALVADGVVEVSVRAEVEVAAVVVAGQVELGDERHFAPGVGHVRVGLRYGEPRQAVERLMRLDAIVLFPELTF